jgi:hypothetical protein
MLIRILTLALTLLISSQAFAYQEEAVSTDVYLHYVPAQVADGFSRDATLTLSSTDDLDVCWYYQDDSTCTAITEGNQTDSCPPTAGQACLTHLGNGVYNIGIDASLTSESNKMFCIDVQDVQGTRTVGDVILCKYIYPQDRLITTDNVGINLDDTSGTIDAAEIGTDAITAAKIAASAITSSEAPNLDVAVSTNATPTEVQAELVTYDAVVPGDLVTAATVAGAVWDEAKSGHTTSTTFGDLATDLDSVLADTSDIQPNYATSAALAVVDANIDELEQTKCDISAATSSSSFTIATCTDHQGNAITLAADTFVGSYLKAYTNGGSDCNVVGESVFASDLASGVVTVKTSDLVGSDFSATPSTSNCGIIVYP